MDHSLAISRIMSLLVHHVHDRKLGMVSSGRAGFWVRRDPDTVRVADIAFLSKKTLATQARGWHRYFDVAPDFVVEGISPEDSFEHVERKVDDYFAGGSKLVWIVSPRTKRVHVHDGRAIRALGTNDSIEGGDVLPGLQASVAALFERED